MLTDLIKGDQILVNYLCEKCQENGIELIIDPAIKKENLIIIKVDEYYNKNVLKPDHSPDCLVIQNCGTHFDIYIVELKNIKSPNGCKVKDIEEKFKTCLDDFINNRFAHYFYSPNVEIRNIKLYFIADPYQYKQTPQKQVAFSYGPKLDYLLSIRFPRYFNRHIFIEPKLPNPTVKKCMAD